MRSLCRLALTVLVLTASTAWSADFQAIKKTPVYLEAEEAEPLLYLSPGQVVSISSTHINGFQSAEFLVEQTKVRGFIRVQDFKNMLQLNKQVSKPLTKKKKHIIERYNRKTDKSLVIAMQGTWIYQGESELNGTADQVFSLSSVSGISYGFSLGTDFVMNEDWFVRLSIAYRSLAAKGDAGLVLSGEPSATEQVQRTQNLLGVGIMAGNRFSANSQSWWGVGCEISKLLSSKTTLADDAPVESEVKQIPPRIVLYGAYGLEYTLSDRIHWGPELHLGAIVNTKPVTYFAEISVNLLISI